MKCPSSFSLSLISQDRRSNLFEKSWLEHWVSGDRPAGQFEEIANEASIDSAWRDRLSSILHFMPRPHRSRRRTRSETRVSSSSSVVLVLLVLDVVLFLRRRKRRRHGQNARRDRSRPPLFPFPLCRFEQVPRVGGVVDAFGFPPPRALAGAAIRGNESGSEREFSVDVPVSVFFGRAENYGPAVADRRRVRRDVRDGG